MIKTTFITALFLLYGCASQETLLRNSTGAERYCYLVHNSTIISAGAYTEYNRCLNEAGMAGFRRVGQ